MAQSVDDCAVIYHQAGNLWIATGDDPTTDLNLSQIERSDALTLAPSRSWDGQLVVYTSTQANNWDLYLTTVEGDPPQQLTTTPTVIELDPAFSPDGLQISFDANPDGNWDIYLMQVATGESTRLTDDSSNDINAAWSPAGGQIIFQSDRANGVWGLYTLDVESREVSPLSSIQGDFDAAYSPDGTMVAFRSARDSADGEDSSLYIMPVVGGDEVRISALGQDSLYQVWSPDGGWIAYQAAHANREYAVYLYEVETGQTYQVTAHQVGVTHISPTWGCEAENMIFGANPNGDFDLYQVSITTLDTFPIQLGQEFPKWRGGAGDQRDPLGYPYEENASRRGTLPPPVE